MAGDMYRKPIAGAPLGLSAKLMGQMIDVARGKIDLRGNVAQVFRQSGIIKVYNDTGSNLSAFNAISLGSPGDLYTPYAGGPTILPADNENEFKANYVFRAQLPYYKDVFAVTIEPIPDDAVGRAAVSGVVPIKVSYTDINDPEPYVQPVSGAAGYVANAASGPARLLWLENDTSPSWGLINLGQSGGFEGARYRTPGRNIAAAEQFYMDWCTLEYDTGGYKIDELDAHFYGFNSRWTGIGKVLASLTFTPSGTAGATPWLRMTIGNALTVGDGVLVPVVSGQAVTGQVYYHGPLGISTPIALHVNNLSGCTLTMSDGFLSLEKVPNYYEYPLGYEVDADCGADSPGTSGGGGSRAFDTVTFTIAGVANGSCDECSIINASYVLTVVTPLYFRDDALGTICDPQFGTNTILSGYIYWDSDLIKWVLVLQGTDGVDEFSGFILALYTNNTGVTSLWDGTAMTMTRDEGYGEDFCSNWPATISVTGA